MAYVKFGTNIPETITFNFNDPLKDKKTKEDFSVNQWGNKQYAYGVEWKGDNAYLYASDFLNDKLKEYAPLQGKTLEIVKVELDGGKKGWVVSEFRLGESKKAGVVSPIEKGAKEGLEGRFEALAANIKQSFAERDKKIAQLTERVEFLEGYNESVKGNEPFVPQVEDNVEAKDFNVDGIPF